MLMGVLGNIVGFVGLIGYCDWQCFQHQVLVIHSFCPD